MRDVVVVQGRVLQCAARSLRGEPARRRLCERCHFPQAAATQRRAQCGAHDCRVAEVQVDKGRDTREYAKSL